jgi:radical SAM/Cys-rich protein
VDIGSKIPGSLSSPRAAKSRVSRRNSLASPREQLSRLTALDLDGAQFERSVAAAGFDGVEPVALDVFQINLGKLCNMTCRHCHVDAGPDRADAMMTRSTIDACLVALDKTRAKIVDLTGGAPELHPEFRYLVEEATRRGLHVIDRCNLTVLLLDRFKDLPRWLAEKGVEIVASLPHFRKRSTDAQRGDGTFEQSLRAIRLLNEHGYGKGDPRRLLTLMSNPAGAFLAGDQKAMEIEWKDRLAAEHGLHFDRLFVLNNMPISRFLEWLADSGNLEGYMERLVGAFNPSTVAGLMCRNTISVSWDGRIYDRVCRMEVRESRTLILPYLRRAASSQPVTAMGARRGAGRDAAARRRRRSMRRNFCGSIALRTC